MSLVYNLYLYKFSPNGAQARKTIPASVTDAKQLILFVTYYERDTKPQLTTADRDNLIRVRYANGEAVTNLAKDYGISDKRIYQIVHFKGK